MVLNLKKFFFVDKVDKRHFFQMDCPICLDQIEHEDKFQTYCCHVFHKECIEKWFNRSHKCPLCRKSKFNISMKDYENNYLQKSNEMTQKIKQCSNPLFKFSNPPKKKILIKKEYHCKICKGKHKTWKHKISDNYNMYNTYINPDNNLSTGSLNLIQKELQGFYC